jgi:hypothetical protein
MYTCKKFPRAETVGASNAMATIPLFRDIVLEETRLGNPRQLLLFNTKMNDHSLFRISLKSIRVLHRKTLQHHLLYPPILQGRAQVLDCHDVEHNEHSHHNC